MFNHNLMDHTLYQGLHTPRACAAFVSLVYDYMGHLRSDPQATCPESWDAIAERESAEKFLAMINNDIAWPIVKDLVPEFKMPT